VWARIYVRYKREMSHKKCVKRVTYYIYLDTAAHTLQVFCFRYFTKQLPLFHISHVYVYIIYVSYHTRVRGGAHCKNVFIQTRGQKGWQLQPARVWYTVFRSILASKHITTVTTTTTDGNCKQLRWWYLPIYIYILLMCVIYTWQ